MFRGYRSHHTGVSHNGRVQWLWQFGIVGLMFSVLFLILLRTYADHDLWGHLRFGLDMVSQRNFVFNDPYSYVTDQVVWINHEWLTEVLMAIAWTNAGSAGLIALKMLVLSATLGIVFFHLAWLLRLPPLHSAAVIVLLVPGLTGFVHVVRPQLFTFLFFALTLVTVYQAESGRYRWLWLMPPVMALWMNLHGGVLAGFGILGLWTLLHVARKPDTWFAMLPPVLLSTAALLLTPYGPGLLLFLFETATVPRPEISDWQPLRVFSIYGMIYLMMLAISGISIVRSRRSRQWILLALFAVTALMPFVAARHLPLMALSFSVFIGEHLIDSWLRWRGQTTLRAPNNVWLAALPIFLSVSIVLLAPTVDRGKIFIDTASRYPHNALTLLKAGGFQGNLATFFNWGEYIIWHAGPTIQVSIDGRRETVYSLDIYRKYLNLQHGTGDWQALLTEYPTDAALFDRGSAADNLLRLSPAWLLIYEDEGSVLYVNKASEHMKMLERVALDFQPSKRSLYFP